MVWYIGLGKPSDLKLPTVHLSQGPRSKRNMLNKTLNESSKQYWFKSGSWGHPNYHSLSRAIQGSTHSAEHTELKCFAVIWNVLQYLGSCHIQIPTSLLDGGLHWLHLLRGLRMQMDSRIFPGIVLLNYSCSVDGIDLWIAGWVGLLLQ